MEVMTMESAAYRELVAKIELIAGYVRQHAPKKREAEAVVWISGKELKAMLGISTRTLQRLRDNKRINYAIFRGACRYNMADVDQLVSDSIYISDPKKLEEFKRNYLLRTGGEKR